MHDACGVHSITNSAIITASYDNHLMMRCMSDIEEK